MTVEEQAARCRRGLDATLRSVHKSTMCLQGPADILLHSMNEVLRAAVASNFGAASRDAINSLYESIGREEPGMVDRCEDLPLLFFARSFATVLEEAVRQLQQIMATVCSREVPQLQQLNTVTVPCNAPCASVEASMHIETPRKEEQIEKKEENAVKEMPKKEETERKIEPPAAAANAAPTAVVRTPQQLLQRPAAAVAVRPARGMQVPHPTNPDKIRDYSPRAVACCINIYDVPRGVSEEEIRKLLVPFGSILFLSYTDASKARSGFGYALARLQSNEAADAAVAALDRCKVGGGTVRFKRSEFMDRWKTQRDRSACDLPLTQFGCYMEPQFATVDSDDETEVLRDNLSCCSGFSVD